MRQQDKLLSDTREICRIWKVDGEHAKDKEWFVKKSATSFSDDCAFKRFTRAASPAGLSKVTATRKDM
jgi:hypothetical protein